MTVRMMMMMTSERYQVRRRSDGLFRTLDSGRAVTSTGLNVGLVC